ncbi:antA/AntB antirepressor family protein [Roseomonas sp. NAR14]|uniref:AntA/AntB antirepressor family protein n=1 Tax=Roseomonas acroporae TaxID=2937791 RepID=A0A9X1Y8W1_9PROT|nr:antA/AntB antirepressor family protein [Roseomonas acroporae]
MNARELHGFLGVGKRFTTWIQDRIAQYGFVAGVDFTTAAGVSLPEPGSAKARAQTTSEYHLTLDMAKELAMVERNDAGKRARQYFIECERRAKAAMIAPTSPLEVISEVGTVRVVAGPNRAPLIR